MLKSLIPLAALLTMAGCASTAQPRLDHVSAANNNASENRVAPCITTGSRIIQKPDECANPAGRSYSKEELDRTGAFTPGEALQMLDPAFSR